MAFRVGQKVVCVKEGLWTCEKTCPEWCSHYRPKLPQYGDILTIREISSGDDGHFIRFVELNNAGLPTLDGEFQFSSIQFRPLVERKTDISIFTAMLNPSKQTVDARQTEMTIEGNGG